MDLCSGKKLAFQAGLEAEAQLQEVQEQPVVLLCPSVCASFLSESLISPCTESDRFVDIKPALQARSSGVSKEDSPCNSTRDLPPCLVPSLSRENLFHWTAVTVMM